MRTGTPCCNHDRGSYHWRQSYHLYAHKYCEQDHNVHFDFDFDSDPHCDCDYDYNYDYECEYEYECDRNHHNNICNSLNHHNPDLDNG